MILRRFMKHFTDQNWFAVGLDVIVVIVGIFLGLQVQGWNETRLMHQEEQIYLERLHDEVQLLEETTSRRHDRGIKIVDNIEEAIDILTGNIPFDQIGVQHCTAIATSDVYTRPRASIMAVTEILASERAAIFQNRQIIHLLSDYVGFLEGFDNLIGTIRNASVLLQKDFPELFHLNSSAGMRSPSFDEQTYTCNFDLMKENAAFKNVLYSNGRKYSPFILFIRLQNEKLVALHQELDAELGIIHGETS